MRRVRRTIWRHPEWSAIALVVAAWAASGRAMQMSSAPATAMDMDGGGGMRSSASALGVGWIAAWLVMATAMMVPSALPTIRHLALTSRWRRRQSIVAIFLSGYLCVWLLFGIAAAGLVALVRHSSSFGTAPVATAALVAAAAWELTPWKRRALRACRLVAPLPPRGRLATERRGRRAGSPRRWRDPFAGV